MHKTRIKKKIKRIRSKKIIKERNHKKKYFENARKIKLIRIKKEEQKESVISFESQCRKTIDIK